MLVPPAMNIESALDLMKYVPQNVLNDEATELIAAMGADTCAKLGIKFPISDELIIGYRLGLQTARAVLAGSAALLLKGVDPKTVL